MLIFTASTGCSIYFVLFLCCVQYKIWTQYNGHQVAIHSNILCCPLNEYKRSLILRAVHYLLSYFYAVFSILCPDQKKNCSEFNKITSVRTRINLFLYLFYDKETIQNIIRNKDFCLLFF